MLRVVHRGPGIDVALGVLLAGLLVLLAFTTGSGVVVGSGRDLGANTWAEIVMTLLGAAALVAVLLCSARGRAWGASALLALTALTVLTALSITWSVQADASWTAANQTVAYLAMFAVGIAAARLAPGRWPALIGGLGGLAVVISAVALAGKVFYGLPGSIVALGRLTAPLGYWNAIGLLAAMGLAPLLWSGARRDLPWLPRALTVPAIAILGATVVLSYSRSALVVAILCLGFWFWQVPLRLRAAVVLLPGLVGAAAISIWALVHHALSQNNANRHPAAQTSAQHTFGLVLVLVLVLSLLAGIAAVRGSARWRPSAQQRRRLGIGLVILAALIPVGGVAALAGSSRGLTGEVSHLWTTLTSTKAAVGSNPGRITSVASSRPAYWRSALTIAGHHPLAGVGALGYATARERYVFNGPAVENAHSFMFETLADLGLIGVAVMVALLAAWAISCRRTIGSLRPGGGSDAERAGLLTLLTVVLTFGVQSAIDWTWYVPAVAVPALLCAGWLAGRGPADEPIGARARPRGLLSHPALPLTVTAITVIALALGWAIWQPLRSTDADDAAIVAAQHHDGAAALTDARAAVTDDPLSLQARSDLAYMYEGAGNLTAARAELVQETRVQPDNFVSWRDLGTFDLSRHSYRLAQKELTLAHVLNQSDTYTTTAFVAAVDAVNREKFR
ncbi:MAG TPA: O-antigen ligase family protein [Solirubrobacteraceae bacterium]|nr:O-antigen ligase family protein [Solirubrobacteraceae bacterium]